MLPGSGVSAFVSLTPGRLLKPELPVLIHRFKHERDPLTSPDAQCHDAALDAVALHRMKEASGQHGARRTDRMTVRDGAAFNVHDILGQTQLSCHRNGDRGEGFVDFDTFDVAELPAARSSAWRTAGIGPSPNMPGSTAPMP